MMMNEDSFIEIFLYFPLKVHLDIALVLWGIWIISLYGQLSIPCAVHEVQQLEIVLGGIMFLPF